MRFIKKYTKKKSRYGKEYTWKINKCEGGARRSIWNSNLYAEVVRGGGGLQLAKGRDTQRKHIYNILHG